jgi:hypothetical protein
MDVLTLDDNTYEEELCMDLENWFDQMQEQLKLLNLCFPQTQNVIFPTIGIHEFKNLGQMDFSAEFIEFYSKCGGLDLPSIWNGYFIFTPPKISQLFASQNVPTKVISENYNGSIMVFGSDGGGNLFAAYENAVLYLPHAIISNQIITYSYTPKPLLLSEEFNDFLERLLADTIAFIKRDPTWVYMDKDLYG